jgi:2-keto-4-pentenoate hydratase/2-oxohepta-3-ene-1,7-dioic acid hydratase in catechol pathway
MKIVTFRNGTPAVRTGALVNEQVIDLNRADQHIPPDLLSLIESGQQGLDAVRQIISGVEAVRADAIHELADVRLVAPWPGKRIAMAGGNYGRHLLGALKGGPRPDSMTLEQAIDEIRSEPPWGFWKTLDWVTSPGDQLLYPRRTRHLDYEGEAAIVFAKPGKDIKSGQINDYIWGITLLNDWSDRDDSTAPRPMSYNLHKNFDGSVTIGPCIVVDELDPQDIDVETRVNSEIRQQYNTKEMVYSFGEYAEALTRDLTLAAGDILSGGTGAGTAMDIVGVDHKDDPESARWFVKPGDVVEVSSPQIGAFSNQVIDGSRTPA